MQVSNEGIWDQRILFNKFTIRQVLFVLIILTAAFLRLYHLEYMEFKGDEARNSFKALRFAREGNIPLTAGISSTGINEPPIFIYLLTIPYLLTSNPIFAAGFIAILNILGVVLCYHFVKKFYSVRAALITIALYAVNPWQVLFSRKIWTQNLLPPFILLFLYFIFQAIYNKNKNHIIYALFVLGILLQLHLSSAYFILLAIVLIAINHKAIDKKRLVLGIIAFLLTCVPYLIFQIQNNFVDVYTMLEIMKQESKFHTEVFTIPFQLITTQGFDYSFGNDISAFEDTVISIPLLDKFLSLLLFASFLFIFYKSGKKAIIFCLWLIIGLLYMAVNKVETIYMHYFHSFFPLFFILIGILISRFYDKIPLYGKYLTDGFIVVVVLYQLSFSIHFLNFIKEKKCILGDYGIPYLYRKNEVAKIIQPLDISTIQTTIKDIHEKVCQCPKCDFLATQFIVKHLRKEYNGWYVPDTP